MARPPVFPAPPMPAFRYAAGCSGVFTLLSESGGLSLPGPDQPRQAAGCSRPISARRITRWKNGSAFSGASIRAVPVLLAAAWLAWTYPATAQQRIYRCGSEYTNSATEAAQRSDCQLLKPGNITVVHGNSSTAKAAARANGSTSARAAVVPGAAARPVHRIDPEKQRARDSDARAILLAELAKAQERLTALQNELSNSTAQRTPQETEHLKTRIARRESDVAGIQRELSRLPGGG